MILIVVAFIAVPIIAMILPVAILARSTGERLTGLLLGGSSAAVTLAMLRFGVLPDPAVWVWRPDNIILQYLWAGSPMAVVTVLAAAIGVWSRRFFERRQQATGCKVAARPPLGGAGRGMLVE